MPAPKPLGERDANLITHTPGGSEKLNGGKKRKSGDANEPPVDPDDIKLPNDTVIEWSADQIRSKIRQYINSGEMKVGEFQNKLKVSPNSYRNFMTQNGPEKGIYGDTYSAACEFFKKREIAGLKMPRQKKAKTSSTSVSKGKDKDNNNDSTAKSKKQLADQDKAKHDVSSIQLPGESNLRIPIYDTCDDLRTKINRYMRETHGATNAGFIREINAAAFPADAPSHQPASTRQLTTFLSGKGPVKGCESPVFYASYVFFEKLRIKEGKAKSKKRTEMEDVWGASGMDCNDFTHRGILATPDSKPSVDKYGKLHFG